MGFDGPIRRGGIVVGKRIPAPVPAPGRRISRFSMDLRRSILDIARWRGRESTDGSGGCPGCCDELSAGTGLLGADGSGPVGEVPVAVVLISLAGVDRPMVCRLKALLAWAMTGLVGLFAGGCFTGSYDSLVAKRLETLQEDSAHNRLARYLSTPLPGAGANLRIPAIFSGNDPTVETSYTKLTRGGDYRFDKEGKADPVRVEPPFLQGMPGFQYALQAYVSADDTTEYPCYLYIATPRVDSVSKAALEADVRTKLIAKFGEDAGAWEDVACRRPRGEQGEPVPWRRIVAQGPQKFAVVSGRRHTWEDDVEGTFEAYLYAEKGADFYVLLAWRIPEKIDGRTKLSQLAEAAASTVRFEDPNEDDPPARKGKESKSRKKKSTK
jgi:hypothetical protein